MPMVLDQQEELSLIHLEGAIDISSAVELKKLLLQATALGKNLSVDLEHAAEVDLTAWQLLSAAAEVTTKADLQFALIGQRQESVAVTLHDSCVEFKPGRR